MTITEFLEARITEDEAVARDIAGCESRDPEGQGYSGTVMEMEGSARYGVIAVDPARLLAECAAKRAIIEMHRRTMDTYGDALGDTCTMCADSGPDAQPFPCDTLKALAAVYKDHPDYQPEWA